MRPSLVQTRIEHRGRAFERFETHPAGNVGNAREAFRPENRESADRVHRLGAIKKCQPLLCFEALRLKLYLAKRFDAFHSFALKKRLALTNQAQGEMGQRSEVAARADRAFLRNYGRAHGG